MRLGKLCSPTICFVAGDSFYQALPQLDTNANLVAVEAMSLACEALGAGRGDCRTRRAFSARAARPLIGYTSPTTEPLVATEPGIGVPRGNTPDKDRTNTKP